MNDFEVEPLGNNLYKVVEVPLVDCFGCFEYQDTVELAFCDDGVYELRSVKELGRWRRFDFLVSLEYAESESCARLLLRVGAFGGVRVRDFGACLSILLPPNSIWDPTEDVGGE